MHHLGILAHSSEGAALCFREFCHRGAAELGPYAHPNVTLDFTALSLSMPFWNAGEPAKVRPVLAESCDRLAAAGADFFVCPDNTAHLALELAGPALRLPGLHIAEIAADHARTENRRRVGILGTRFTMDGPVYPQALERRGIESVVPAAGDRAVVDRIIFDELVNGIVTEASRREYQRVIVRLAERGCDAVALVCTEIPLLVDPSASSLPTLDSTRLVSAAALDVCLGRAPFPVWRGGPVD